MQRFFGRLETCVFYLLIFAIPFETRLIVARWTQPFNEWTASYIYVTDILLILLFIFWLLRNVRTRGAKISNQIANPNFFLFLFFIVSALSIFNSRIVGLSLYQLLKLAEFIGFYFYLRSAFGKIYKFRNILMVIMTSGIFQAAIAIAQYFKQGSLGLKLFGESPLSVDATGVAVFIADSHKYLRAYGTTPHPNVLAAWLFLAIFAFYNFYFYPKEKSSLGKFFLVCYPILLLGLFFTFSRVIIGLWLLGTLVRVSLLFLKKDFGRFLESIKKRLAAVVILTTVTAGVFSAVYWPQVQSRIHISAEEEAVTQRIFYNKIAERVVVAHPLLGVGIGQFVPQLMNKLKHLPAYFYQPVHNIYLLIASEIGLVGLLFFLLFLFFVLYNFGRFNRFRKPYHFSFFILIFSFLLMGLFDHFLWTLQQGSLIFWITMALISLNPDLG